MVRLTPSPALKRPCRGTAPDVEILQHDGEAQLQHFRVGEPRIRHVRMHGGGAVETFSRRRAGADRLVILMARIAEGEIVHRALRGAERAQCAKQAINDILARLHVACDDGGRPARRKQGALRRNDFQRAKTARIHRDIRVDQHAKT